MHRSSLPHALLAMGLGLFATPVYAGTPSLSIDLTVLLPPLTVLGADSKTKRPSPEANP